MNKNGWMNLQKEIKILQKVVETMKVQLNELQMCKLKLERQVKIWTNQKGKLCFARKNSGWISEPAILKLKRALLCFQEFETIYLYLNIFQCKRGTFHYHGQYSYGHPFETTLFLVGEHIRSILNIDQNFGNIFCTRQCFIVFNLT